MKPCTITGCGLPLSDTPGMVSSKWCYWHRLLRMTVDAQDRAAMLRAEGRHPHPIRSEPGWRYCEECRTWVPPFYLSGPRCTAHARIRSRKARDARTYAFPDGVSRETLETLQERRCAGCGATQRGKALALDHDHATGLVRGLLCQRCNHDLLGAGFDSVKILENLLFYLQHPPSSGRWVPPAERAATGWRLKWVREGA